MRVLLSFLLILAVRMSLGPAMAQTEETRIETRFGMLEVRGPARHLQTIYWSDEPIDLPHLGSVAVEGTWPFPGEETDWVLIRLDNGGNGCVPLFYALSVTDDGVEVSPPIGRCAGELLNVRVSNDGVALDLRTISSHVGVEADHPGIWVDYETFLWDGANLSVTPVIHEAADEPAGAGEDVTRWIGRAPLAIFEDPGERARFATIMPQARVTALANVSHSYSQPWQDGDLVIGTGGCYNHLGCVQRGLWALRISDGAVGAAIMTVDEPVESYGLALTERRLRDRIEIIQEIISN